MNSDQTSAYIVLALVWATWCLLHSLFITRTAVRFLERWLPRYYPYHRMVYNSSSLLTFLLVSIYEHSLPRQALYQFSNLAELGRITLFSLGVVLFLVGAKNYDLFQFAGLRQLFTKKNHLALNRDKQFKKTGISGMTRHPWYLAAFMVIWCNSKILYDQSLITNTVFSIYLVLGTLQEERKLVLEFGEEYRQYQREVSMFLPVKWLRARLNQNLT